MSTTCIIEINGEKINAQRGNTLSDVLRDNGYNFSMPCGGRGICRKCKVLADGKEVLACKYIVTGNVSIELPNVRHKTYTFGEGEVKGKVRIAVDIGTTTVAAAVVDEKNKVLRQTCFANPQSVYGLDVIMRIYYCGKKGVGALRKILLDELKAQLDYLIPHDADVVRIDFAGNTVMLHILLGEDCTQMGEAPYTPSFLQSKCIEAKELGLNYSCKVYTLPCIASFVGGDIVAGLITLPAPQKDKYSLYIDIGTNAEIVLFDDKSYTATAAAAGPCMEGANISCGMSAVEGAITHFEYPDKIKYLGDKPQGICGSALIDIVGQLVKAGVIDKSGYMQDDYIIADGVIFKREDVRQYQLAKSAIRAGVDQLLQYRGIKPSDVSQVYIAGGFSAHIDIDNAVASGLIDAAFKDVCQAVGNRTLEGCMIYCEKSDKAKQIADNAVYLDLNESEGFSDKFIKYMSFGI